MSENDIEIASVGNIGNITLTSGIGGQRSVPGFTSVENERGELIDSVDRLLNDRVRKVGRVRMVGRGGGRPGREGGRELQNAN